MLHKARLRNLDTCIGVAVFFALVTAVNNAAFAFSIGIDLCTMIDNIFYAKLAAGIATIAVIIIGISAAFGSIRPGTAVMVVVGIAIIFSAGSLAIAAGGGCGPGAPVGPSSPSPITKSP